MDEPSPRDLAFIYVNIMLSDLEREHRVVVTPARFDSIVKEVEGIIADSREFRAGEP